MFQAEEKVEQNLRQEFAYSVCEKKEEVSVVGARQYCTKEVRDIKMTSETQSRLSR